MALVTASMAPPIQFRMKLTMAPMNPVMAFHTSPAASSRLRNGLKLESSSRRDTIPFRSNPPSSFASGFLAPACSLADSVVSTGVGFGDPVGPPVLDRAALGFGGPSLPTGILGLV